MRKFALAILLLATPAQAQPTDNGTMCPLASALTKVARAVDAYVANNPVAAAKMRGGELLDAATKFDPSLLRAFARFHITARAEDRNSSVLVCTSDQQTGLIEDAGCTARVDAELWQTMPSLACGFVINLGAVCAGSPQQTANLCR